MEKDLAKVVHAGLAETLEILQSTYSMCAIEDTTQSMKNLDLTAGVPGVYDWFTKERFDEFYSN
jgi:hypothetical protein